jgi:outer membrane protein assembly factor BamB
MGVVDGTEYVFALDASTGNQIWEAPNGGHYRNNRGDGPRGTPTVDGHRLYALGGLGDFSCRETETGRVVWSVNLLRTFKAKNTKWGLSESPLIVGDKVLVNAGGRDASIVAFNKNDGSVLWSSQSDEAGYSSAIYTEIGGVPQAIFLTGERALGLDIRNGELLWSYDKVSNRTANVATPVLREPYVFVSSAYGTGGALLELQPANGGIGAREVYFQDNMRNHHMSSILVGDTLYGFSDAIFTAMRFNDGEILWKDRSVGKGSLVYADGHFVALSEKGVVGLIEATPAEYREKGRFRLPDLSGENTWAHPVIANGHLYIRDQGKLRKYDIRSNR